MCKKSDSNSFYNFLLLTHVFLYFFSSAVPPLSSTLNLFMFLLQYDYTVVDACYL